jgi:hypothetical protein
MAREVVVEPRNDAYTGLLAISLIAMVAACALLYLDYSQYEGRVPPALPQVNVPGAKGSAAPILQRLPAGKEEGKTAPAPEAPKDKGMTMLAPEEASKPVVPATGKPAPASAALPPPPPAPIPEALPMLPAPPAARSEAKVSAPVIPTQASDDAVIILPEAPAKPPRSVEVNPDSAPELAVPPLPMKPAATPSVGDEPPVPLKPPVPEK